MIPFLYKFLDLSLSQGTKYTSYLCQICANALRVISHNVLVEDHREPCREIGLHLGYPEKGAGRRYGT